MQEKLFYPENLYKIMKELGLPTGKMWLLRQEKAKRFKPRRDPKGWRRFTEKDMNQIVKEFSPGGKGSWEATPGLT